MLNLGIKLTELGIIPESILRKFIKKLIQHRLLEIPINAEVRESKKADFIEELQSSPIALSTRQANEQHYEVPPAFFHLWFCLFHCQDRGYRTHLFLRHQKNNQLFPRWLLQILVYQV